MQNADPWIADCRLRSADLKTFNCIITPIRNPQSAIRNLEGMADPPRLIAKTRCQMGQSENTAGVRWKILMMKAILKTWPATPVGKRRSIRTVLHQAKPKLFLARNSRGRSAIQLGLRIADFGLRIGNLKSEVRNQSTD